MRSVRDVALRIGGSSNDFRLIFTAKDHTGMIVARTITKTITITDDHKDLRVAPNDETLASNNSSFTAVSTAASQQQQQQQQQSQSSIPPSPVSMEESSEANTDFSSSSVKRRRDSSWSGNIRTNSSNSNNFQAFLPSIQQVQQQQQQQQQQQPISQSRLSSRNPSFSRNKSSGHLDMSSPTSSDNLASAVSLSKFTPNISRNNSFSRMNDANVPQIQRIIPSQGSVRGGIEVTLLGSGFYNGLITKFGDVAAMATQCWSDSTIVAHLPPATTAGPVVVTFEGITRVQPQVFTYIDDTDSQLIELALQVVGLKMNGKLEDAKNIAMRIVGSSKNKDNSGNGGASSGSNINGSTLNSADHEKIILRCIDLIKMNSGKIPNWQLRNSEGQTMMHLASSLGFYKVVSALISQGARIDQQDVNGMTPLHFAALRGRRAIVRKLLRCRADPFIRAINGQSVIDIADDCVIEDLPIGLTHRQYNEFSHARRTSSTSTFASFKSNRRFSEQQLATPASSGSSYRAFYDESEYDGDTRKDRDEDYDEENGDDDSSEYDDGDLRMGDVRQALLRHRRKTSSISHHSSDIEEESVHSTDQDSTMIANDNHHNEFWNNPRDRLNNTAENISLYLQQLTETARNRMKPWDRPNWDEIVNYVYRRSDTRQRNRPNRDYTSSAASDSDATVLNNTRSTHSRDLQQKNLLRVWQFLTQSAEQHQQQAGTSSASATVEAEAPVSVSPAPPSYDEIFPDKANNDTTTASVTVSTSTDEKISSTSEVSSEEEEQHNEETPADIAEQYEQQFIRTWVNNKKNLQNDRRLFFFWIPVLVVAITLVILRLSGATPEVYNNLLWTSKSFNSGSGNGGGSRHMPSIGRPLPASLASPTTFIAPIDKVKSEVIIPPMCDLDDTRTPVMNLGIFI